MEGGGPMKLTHLGSSSPLSVHVCCCHLWAIIFVHGQLSSFVGGCPHSWAFVFVGSGLCSWQWPLFVGSGGIGVVWCCHWWLVVVGPHGCLHSRVVGAPCCRVAMLSLCLCHGPCMWCEVGMTKGWVTYLNNLDSDNSMHRHHLNDVAHLPRCFHNPLGDVALPRCCWLAVCVMGVVSGCLMAGDGDAHWRQW